MGGDKIRTLSVRIPEVLWKRLMRMRITGKIKSINQAVIDGLEIIVKRAKGDKDDQSDGDQGAV